MTCKDDKTRKCKPSGPNFKSLEDVVAAYIKVKRKEAEEDLRYYAKLPSFEDVVEQAALAKGPWNGIHDHQRRVGALNLSKFAVNLLEALPKLKKVANFEELYNAIEARKVCGVGKLTLYDTALRIGTCLKIEPREVYLHRGAKDGAKTLGIALRGRRAISVEELPSAFCKLKPREIEDCLCIYKEAFAVLQATHLD